MTLSCAEPIGSGGLRRVLIGCLGGPLGSSANRLREATSMSKKEVWTMSTLPTPDSPVHPPNCPGYRIFPALPSNRKAQNRVRVPPRARRCCRSGAYMAPDWGQAPKACSAA